MTALFNYNGSYNELWKGNFQYYCSCEQELSFLKHAQVYAVFLRPLVLRRSVVLFS
jgi:hypothetical protein